VAACFGRWRKLSRARPATRPTEPFFRALAVTSAKSMTSPAVKILGSGLRRPCLQQTFGGMHGAITRIAPARPATRPTSKLFPMAVPDQAQLFQRGGRHAGTQRRRSQNPTFSLGKFLLTPPWGGGGFCSKLRAPHQGTSLGPFACGAKNRKTRGLAELNRGK
jgi:hypothetical protein